MNSSRRRLKRTCKTETQFNEFHGLTDTKLIDEKFQLFQKQAHAESQKVSHIQPDPAEPDDLDIHAKLLHKLVIHSEKNSELTYRYRDICDEFGIDFNHLKSLRTLDEKQNYVVERARNVIHSQLEGIMLKYYEKEQQIPRKQETRELDLYGWLKVKSQYKQLRKILQYSLIELVQQQDNKEKINRFFDLTQRSERKHLKTESKDFSTYHTFRIITTEDEPKTLKLNIPDFNFQNPDLFFEWNKAIDLGFIKANRNLLDTGFSTMKKQLQNGVNYRKREKLLEKCTPGGYITEEELRYLAQTSYLMNKCLDKQFIQRVISFLDESCIQQIESKIAEQILRTYEYLIRNQKKARQQYLEERNKVLRSDIKKKSKIYEKQRQVQSNVNQVKIIKKKLITMLKDISKKKELKEAAEKKKRQILRIQRKQGNPLANIYVQKFKEIVLQVVSRMRDKKVTAKEKQIEFLERNEAKPPLQPVYMIGNEAYDYKKCQRRFHPPSKLMTHLSEDKQKISDQQAQKKETKSYRLGIRNYAVTKPQFSAYYSGGPQSSRQLASPELQWMNGQAEHPPQHTWITHEAEVAAANKIKFAIKRYIQKKALDKLIVKKEVKKNVEIENKIKKCLAAKKFFQELHRELDLRQTEKLKDLSVHPIPMLELEKIPLLPQESSSPQVPRKSMHLNIQLLRKIKNNPDVLDTARRVEENIKEINRRKRLMKFSKQKEMSEAKLKNRKLIIAAKMRNLQVAITAGFTYNQQDTRLHDKHGNTPLYYTASNGDEQFCRYLLNLGADVNQSCQNGNTPMHMAFQSGNIQIVIDFINHHGNLNALNHDNFTPLAFGSEELLKKLNLFHSVASIAKARPRTVDNHSLFHQKMKPQEPNQDEGLLYDHYKPKQVF